MAIRRNVTYYGVHWTDEKVAYLEQGGPKGGHNMIGLNQPSPFRVQARGEAPCNHLIPMAIPKPDERHQRFLSELAADPLVHAMLPIPHDQDRTFYIQDAHDDLHMHLVMLSKMSSPVETVVHPVANLSGPQILDELSLSNVQPLVITGVTAEHNQILRQVGAMASKLPRTLIMTGADDVDVPSSIRLIDTDIDDYDISDLIVLHWEALGAWAIKEWMKGKFRPPAPE